MGTQISYSPSTLNAALTMVPQSLRQVPLTTEGPTEEFSVVRGQEEEEDKQR